MQLQIEVKANALPSRYAIGTVVYFYPDMWRLRPEVADVMALKGRVEKVQFGGGKVTYDLAMECCDSDTKGNVTGKYFYDAITVKDIDSCFVATYDDIVEEWDRTVRITRENAQRQLTEATRRLADLDQGIIIPDNWWLNVTGDWVNPADLPSVGEPAPLSPVVEANASCMFPAVRQMFLDLFEQLRQRKAQREQEACAGAEPRVQWKADQA